MAGTVPTIRPAVDSGNVATGRAVTSETWSQMALLANWVQGRGKVLVPACRPSVNTGGPPTLSAGSYYEYQWTVKPSVQTFQRAWVIQARSSTGLASITPQAGASAAGNESFVINGYGSGPIVYIETVSSQSGSTTTIDLKLTIADQDAVIDSIACYEIPRVALLTNTTDDGCDLALYTSRQPIESDQAGFRQALNAHQRDDFGGRGSLLQWAGAYEEDGTETTGNPLIYNTGSTSWDTILDCPSGEIPVLGKLTDGATETTTLKAKALIKAGAGTRTNFRVSGRRGAGTPVVSSTANTTSTTWVWTTEISVTVDSSDFSDDEFLRSGAWYAIKPELKTDNGAAANAKCAAVSIWED